MQPHIKLIGFALEARLDRNFEHNAAQLVYDLSTAQSQRRALGLKEQVIFGGVYSNKSLTIFSSSWGMVRGISVTFIHPDLLISS